MGVVGSLVGALVLRHLVLSVEHARTGVSNPSYDPVLAPKTAIGAAFRTLGRVADRKRDEMTYVVVEKCE